jgi:N-acetyl-gamma-glutamyl-phosphate reductase
MANLTIKAGIIGAAGYTGGELIRLLLRHPQVQLVFAQSSSNTGNALSDVHRDLVGETELLFSETAPLNEVDVVFLCMAHGKSAEWWANTTVPGRLRVIDLGNDFRHTTSEKTPSGFVYGLPELQKESIKTARLVANPGCFATAIQLALLPLTKPQMLAAAVHVTGITGATGAGQALSASTHFPWRVNNISAYKTLTHQHLGEIQASLQQAQGLSPAVHFVPWRGDFARGIFVSCTVVIHGPMARLQDHYQAFYQSHPFVFVEKNTIDLKQVINTNKCLIQLEKEGDQLVVHACIDNLLKGASGQAVQNMNLMFGIDEAAGLHLKSIAF